MGASERTICRVQGWIYRIATEKVSTVTNVHSIGLGNADHKTQLYVIHFMI